MKFSKEKRRTMADIFGNISSAWFIAGIIGTWFAKPLVNFQLGIDLLVTMLSTLVFGFLAVIITK